MQVTAGDVQRILDKLDQIGKTTTSDKVWDVAGKLLVPLVIGIGAWMVGLEVRTSRLETRMENVPPKWLKDAIEAIKENQLEIKARLRDLERK